jgi:signal transduction histidine kinase
MKPPSAKPRPERQQTDESLRSERKNTDDALTDSRTRTQTAADAVVQRARGHADAVLETARGKADAKLTGRSGLLAREAVAEQRAGEDEALHDERAAADEILRRERVEDLRALAALLPLERQNTDRYLLTERARSDQALSHRDDFLGIVSHDLRNLLGGIAASARLLTKQYGDSQTGKQAGPTVERIQRYAARMNGLIGDLIDVASIDAGKLTVRPTAVNAADLITEAIDAFAHVAQEKGVSLKYDSSERGLAAKLDHGRLLQVLANLITNAVKFTDAGGAVMVRAAKTADALCVSVVDTGIGIPEHMLDSIFERFWQAGKNDRRGVGLGLYISKCIVEAHGGRIWVESKVGAGSALHFTIPSA